MHEYIYSFQKFYLQFVYTSNNKVILYTVTVKDKNFHPRIPYLGKELGDTFDNYDDSAEFLFSGYSSKFYEYHEAIYLGNQVIIGIYIWRIIQQVVSILS